MDEAVLGHYQRRLLALLAAQASPDELIAQLRADPVLEPLRDYIEQLDPHALVVAAELVARWAPDKE
ncbi:MAG: hypothetical protein AAF799_27850 [Myxococcota bacterium]